MRPLFQLSRAAFRTCNTSLREETVNRISSLRAGTTSFIIKCNPITNSSPSETRRAPVRLAKGLEARLSPYFDTAVEIRWRHGTWTRRCPRNTLMASHEATSPIASGGTRSAADFTGMFGEITKSGMNTICCDRSQRIILYPSTLARGDATTKTMMIDVNPCDCDSPVATIWQMRFSSR